MRAATLFQRLFSPGVLSAVVLLFFFNFATVRCDSDSTTFSITGLTLVTGGEANVEEESPIDEPRPGKRADSHTAVVHPTTPRTATNQEKDIPSDPAALIAFGLTVVGIGFAVAGKPRFTAACAGAALVALLVLQYGLRKRFAPDMFAVHMEPAYWAAVGGLGVVVVASVGYRPRY